MRELTPEALDEWRANPVTEFLLDVMKRTFEEHKASFQEEAYTRGEIDRDTLAILHAREGAISDLMETTADEWNGWAEGLER